jgi:3-methyladenine DNA glycosylase/8-oxoguanine DNA glycosylase
MHTPRPISRRDGAHPALIPPDVYTEGGRKAAAQQLTAKAGDAIIARFRALYPETTFSTPEHIIAADFDALRACGFFGDEDRDDQRHRRGLAVWADSVACRRQHYGR